MIVEYKCLWLNRNKLLLSEIQESKNVCVEWIMEKARELQKNICFCFLDYAKAFDCVDHNKLWNILKEMGMSDHLTCLMRILYSGQEATVRTIHGIAFFIPSLSVCVCLIFEVNFL